MTDLRRLPRGASGPRAPLWWGVAWLIVIEGMVVASLSTTWLYLRFHEPRWPPEPIPLPDVAGPAMRALLLAGAAAGAAWAARRGPDARSGAALLGGVALTVAYVALGVKALAGLGFDWRGHAYGSVYWTVNAYSLLHALSLAMLQGAVGGFTLRGRATRLALEVVALYAGFAAASAGLSWLTLSAGPYLLGGAAP